VGSVFGSNPRGSQHNSLGEILGEFGDVPIQRGILLSAALRFVQRNGGIDGILGRLRQSGFAAEADSWVGAGPNLPISPLRLQQVFGATGLDDRATPLEPSADPAGSAMSQILPELVNQFTPQGELPANHAALVTKGLAILSAAGA
jgi:uncharacterized protein YidB (DUF937 family)